MEVKEHFFVYPEQRVADIHWLEDWVWWRMKRNLYAISGKRTLPSIFAVCSQLWYADAGRGGERRCTSNPFVTRQWVTSTTLLSLYLREWPSTHCTGVRVGLEPDLGGTENIIPPRFDPRTVQPAAIRYTDYAIRSHLVYYFLLFV
jgi:hypothetical protein